jgi:hypothetical protein
MEPEERRKEGVRVTLPKTATVAAMKEAAWRVSREGGRERGREGGSEGVCI